MALDAHANPVDTSVMAHHHTIKPEPLRMPTGPGEWIFAPSKWSTLWYELAFGFGTFGLADIHVMVEETPGAGRFCRELRMGGHALCGFDHWSGEWRAA